MQKYGDVRHIQLIEALDPPGEVVEIYCGVNPHRRVRRFTQKYEYRMGIGSVSTYRCTWVGTFTPPVHTHAPDVVQ